MVNFVLCFWGGALLSHSGARLEMALHFYAGSHRGFILVSHKGTGHGRAVKVGCMARAGKGNVPSSFLPLATPQSHDHA